MSPFFLSLSRRPDCFRPSLSVMSSLFYYSLSRIPCVETGAAALVPGGSRGQLSYIPVTIDSDTTSITSNGDAAA